MTSARGVRWRLSDIYEDPEAGIEADLRLAAAVAAGISDRYRGRIEGLAPGDLAEVVGGRERVEEALARAVAYADLHRSLDLHDTQRSALLDHVRRRSAAVENELRFIDDEWSSLPDRSADRALADPTLACYAHHLRTVRSRHRHALGQPEERVLAAQAVTAREAWERLFDDSVSRMRVWLNGRSLRYAQAQTELHSPDAGTRAGAARAISRAMRRDLATRAAALNAVLTDHEIEDGLRGYDTWLSQRNLESQLSDRTVRALLEAVRDRYDIAHRYYALKRRLLGVDRFHEWDRVAPLGWTEPAFTWDEARSVIAAAFGAASPRLGALADAFFERGWIDAEPAAGKQHWTFAHAVTPALHPFVLVSYQDRLRDVLVLAHELGHGVHMALARRQTYLNFLAPIPLAETASTLGVGLALAHLLERETDPGRRLGVMAARLDDAIQNVFRRAAMHHFEEVVHAEHRRTGELAVADFNVAWLASQRTMFGPDVDVSDDFGVWWSVIFQFVREPGYGYAYAFGHLLALVIQERSRQEGAAFSEAVLEVLAAGGSTAPEALLGALGVDPGDPGFWHGGLGILSRLVDEAEQQAAG